MTTTLLEANPFRSFRGQGHLRLVQARAQGLEVLLVLLAFGLKEQLHALQAALLPQDALLKFAQHSLELG